MLKGKFHFNCAPLRIHRRRNRHDPCRKALADKGIRDDSGTLARLQLIQKALIHLRTQLCRPGQCQTHQYLAGLNNLARLDIA